MTIKPDTFGFVSWRPLRCFFFRYALAQLGAKREGGRTLVPSKNAKGPVPAWVKRSTENRQRKALFNPRLTGVYPITRLTGGGGYLEPPSISETAGPIFKFQTVCDSPAKTVDRNQISLTSRSLMTSQIRSKTKLLEYGACLNFRLWRSQNKSDRAQISSHQF